MDIQLNEYTAIIGIMAAIIFLVAIQWRLKRGVTREYQLSNSLILHPQFGYAKGQKAYVNYSDTVNNGTMARLDKLNLTGLDKETLMRILKLPIQQWCIDTDRGRIFVWNIDFIPTSPEALNNTMFVYEPAARSGLADLMEKLKLLNVQIQTREADIRVFSSDKYSFMAKFGEVAKRIRKDVGGGVPIFPQKGGVAGPSYSTGEMATGGQGEG